jgi:hypothetical protein
MNQLLMHPAVFAIAAYWIFSALVGGMPDPTPTSSVGYVWAHKSLHILAGNLTSVVPAKYQSTVTLTKTTTDPDAKA